MTMNFYREPSGDYLVIWPENGYDTTPDRHGVQRVYEGRVAGIEGLISSICTASVGSRFLEECQEVEPKEVPREWMEWLVADDGDDSETACEV
jgi:hypothetical protein